MFKSLEFHEALSDWVDKQSAVNVVCLDFQMAFDKVPHMRLMARVWACGMVASITSWIANWLSDRKQRGDQIEESRDTFMDWTKDWQMQFNMSKCKVDGMLKNNENLLLRQHLLRLFHLQWS